MRGGGGGGNNGRISGDSAEFSETKENLLKLRKHGPKPSSYNDIQKTPVLGRVGLKEVSPDAQHEFFFQTHFGDFLGRRPAIFHSKIVFKQCFG